MLISVIIPTRNRPALFRRALHSVLMQQEAAFEAVVVDDGSDPDRRDEYDAVAREAGERARFLHLPRRPNGHGQSYALNVGAAEARGEWLCMLDDDDEWTDPRHLHHLTRVVAAHPGLDLHFCDQAAYLRDERAQGPIWIEDLGPRLHGRPAEAGGAWIVSVPELLACHGFCHLNTTAVRRAFFQRIGGLDEGIRYECDRDFYLRAIDAAEAIAYSPRTVSRHNIPDPAAKSSMSTIVSTMEKRLLQLRVLDKAILFSRRPEIAAYGRRHKAFTLQRMSEELARDGRDGPAAFYAREAALLRPRPAGLARCALLHLRQPGQRARPTAAGSPA